MSLDVFDPATAGFLAVDTDFRTEDEQQVYVQRFAGQAQEVRAAVQDIGRRTFEVRISATRAESLAVDEFWRLHAYEVTSVLFEDPRLSTRTGVSLGTSVTSQTEFDLPATGENSRDYPQPGISSVTLYDDGSPVSVDTIGTDGRTITAASAPANGSVMTADYSFYRRVRLEGTYSWLGRGPNYFQASMTLREVPS